MSWPPRKSFVKSGSQSFRKSISRLGWRTAFAAIVLGVAGNMLFAVVSLLPQYRDQIGAFLVKTPLFWIIVYATLIGFFGVLLRYNKRRWSKLYVQNHQSEIFVLSSLDDSLLRLLPGLVTTDRHEPCANGQELEVRMDRIVKSFLDDANSMVFHGRARRGLVFCPDDKRERLIIRYKYGWVMDDLVQMGFRIDKGMFEGIVGEAYGKGETIVAHRRVENGQYRWDRDSYVPRVENRSVPQYNAIVCVPIIATSRSLAEDNRLGAVCFDSADMDIFDPPEVRETLEKLARHLATSLQIYGKLLQACSASSCIYGRGKLGA